MLLQCPNCKSFQFMPLYPGKVGRRRQPNGNERFVWEEHYRCFRCGTRYLNETLLEEFDGREKPNVIHL